MPTILHSTPEPADGPPPGTPEPYWQAQRWLPSHRRDTRGMLADLIRRLLTAALHVRWRLTVEVGIDATIDAPDEATATAAVHAALRTAGTLITLSRTDPGAVPPWRCLGVTDRPLTYLDYGADATNPDTDPEAGDSGDWRCVATLVLAFTVDVADASWPDEHYAIDVFPSAAANGLPGPRTITTHAVWIARRVPVRRARHHGPH